MKKILLLEFALTLIANKLKITVGDVIMLGVIKSLLEKKLVMREIGSLNFFRKRARFMGMRSGKMRQ